MDRKALEDLAKGKGIELSYADSVLIESQSKRQGGYLFFYYQNHLEFMLIWSAFNIFFLLLLVILIRKKVQT